jgi:hypothetical protein
MSQFSLGQALSSTNAGGDYMTSFNNNNLELAESVHANMKEKFIADEYNKLEEPLKNSAMESLNTHQGAWTNREEMWTYDDRRMLFATKA